MFRPIKVGEADMMVVGELSGEDDAVLAEKSRLVGDMRYGACSER